MTVDTLNITHLQLQKEHVSQDTNSSLIQFKINKKVTACTIENNHNYSAPFKIHKTLNILYGPVMLKPLHHHIQESLIITFNIITDISC